MTEQENPTTIRDRDEARDLRNALLFGGLIVWSFGVMILASGPALQIPPLENALVALCGALVAVGGLAALQMNWPVRRVAWLALLAYTVIVSLAVHFTGGPLTPMPALYLLVVMAASFLLGRRGATQIAVFSVLCYAVVLLLEYTHVLSMVLIWRLEFDPRERGFLLVINWLAVSIPALVTAQLAGTLAERLRRSNAQLRESERLRDSLTQMIVHDLRNPLVGLTGWLDLMQSTQEEEMTGTQRLMLENARHGGQMLMHMISELLDISKMEAGKLSLDLEPTDLGKLVAESVEAMRGVIKVEELEVQINQAEKITVLCDRQLIGRVVANLLSNAIKHTPSEGIITLNIRRRGDEAVEVSVKDTGIGIPKEYRQRIFEKFGQVGQPGIKRRGTGLGLTFCRMAVEAHGGQIWVESQMGQGSTFFFTIPLDVQAGRSSPVSQA